MNNYSISIIKEPKKNCKCSVTTLKYKSASEVEKDGTKKENETERKENDSNSSHLIDFETAISATEYGKYNWLLLFAAFWGFMSCMNATTTISLILPSAECDLHLSNFDKGLLNSVIYIGMIISAFFWGLLSDAVGRKNILVAGFALDAFFSTLVGLAQNFTLLVTAKLFTGFISSGPMAILQSFLAENHSNTYRASIIVWTGVFTSLATIILPFLAWLIIPRPIRIILFNGYFSLPSWRIFLLVSALPSILALIGFLCFDESPKFLMFQGNNEKALRVMGKIYEMNTGKHIGTFPVKCLRNEMGNDQNEMKKGKVSIKQIILTGWKQMVPMFQKPHVSVAFLPCFIQLCNLLGVNTVRLWSPQLFASAIELEKYSYNFTKPSSVCELLGSPENAIDSMDTVDQVILCDGHVEDKVYFNSMITGTVTAIGYLISGYIIKIVDKKWLMITAYTFSIACCMGLYWSTTSDILLGVISIYIAVTSTAATALVGTVIDIFPTSLRTTAISLCMTFGRLGAMVGNMTFPVLLSWHCSAPFILLGVVLLSATLKNDVKNPSPVSFETAISLTGFGKFHYLLVLLSGAIYCSVGFQNGLNAYVMPSAACDLKMSSNEKGLLNAVFLGGGIASSLFWGILADHLGRKKILVLSLIFDSIVTIVSSFSQTFLLFAIFRFLNGFLIGAPGSIITAYLGEFLSDKHRAPSLCAIVFFWTLSWMILPVVALGVIPITWSYESGGFLYNSWRIYVVLMAIPSLLCGITLGVFFPESPKFLFYQGKEREAVEILQSIYRVTHGSNKEYPVRGLLPDENVTSVSSDVLDGVKKVKKNLKFSSMYIFRQIWLQFASLFRFPIINYTILASSLTFSNMFGYYGLGLWLPEIFNRFEDHYKVSNVSVTVCEVTQSENAVFDTSGLLNETLHPTVNYTSPINPDVNCSNAEINENVFIRTFIIGASCLVGNALAAASVNKVGLKVLTIVTALVSGVCAILIYFLRTPNQNLLVACIFLTFVGTENAVISSATVELFPTKVKALGICVALFAGRLGAVCSNLVLGYLFDISCKVPIFLMGFILLVGVVLGFFLPGKQMQNLESKSESSRL